MPLNPIDFNPAYEDGVWQNANTYAPWDQDVGDTWLNALAGAYPNESNPTGWNWQNLVSHGIPGLVGMPLMPALAEATGGFNPFADSWGGFMHSISGKGKKRSSPDFYAPSYQGLPFMPQEGLGDYEYGVTGAGGAPESMEFRQSAAQAQQMKSLQDSLQGSFYDYNYGKQPGEQTQVPQQQTQAYSFDSFQPNYVGQTPYGYKTESDKTRPGYASTFSPSSGFSQY